MRYFVFFIVYFFFTDVRAQDTLILNSWKDLSRAFQRRSDIFENIARTVSKTILVDSNAVAEVTQSKVALKKVLNSMERFDSIFIKSVESENAKLLKTFSRISAALFGDSLFKSTDQAANMQTELMAIENRILYTKKKFNQLCLSKKRHDLIYH